MISRTVADLAAALVERGLGELVQVVHVEQRHARDLAGAGVDVTRHGDVDDEQRRTAAALHDRLDVGALDVHLGGVGRGEQHVDAR